VQLIAQIVRKRAAVENDLAAVSVIGATRVAGRAGHAPP